MIERQRSPGHLNDSPAWRWYASVICIIVTRVTSGRCGAIPTTSPPSLPVNDYRCLHGLLMDFLHCYVVPQGIKGPSDEGRLSIKEGPQGRQALRRGPQESGPEGVLQRLCQSGLTWNGSGEKATKSQSKLETQSFSMFPVNGNCTCIDICKYFQPIPVYWLWYTVWLTFYEVWQH